ncbi:MAG: hypothetical protein K2Y27_26140 [Xanthobacteraceae bacterium]|nr:hypothetical protein [Xanthobacteraceae bacterium]
MIATLMFVCSTLMRAIRKSGRGVSLVANSYNEAADLRLAARKAFPFSEG